MPSVLPALCATPLAGCACCSLTALRRRRRFTHGLAAGSLWALAVPAPLRAQDKPDDGVTKDVGRTSPFARLASAEAVEAEAAQQYLQMTREFASKQALAPPGNPQVQRLRAIAQRILPFAPAWNPRARQWRWEVNLLASQELNAFCMPGGKIAFYSGILQKLQLNDDEVAAIMGHEIAHALREHARERIGADRAKRELVDFGSALFNLGQFGRLVADGVGYVATLKFSRNDETEADIVGMDLAARAGYDPAAGVALWQKMLATNKGAPPQWMSTHPAGDTRIRDIQAKLPKVQPLYDKAAKPAQRFAIYPAG